jgi:hypothetical protein
MVMAGGYNEIGTNRLTSILILPRIVWFAMIAVALSDLEANRGVVQREMELQI